jgi:hypothetical protein
VRLPIAMARLATVATIAVVATTSMSEKARRRAISVE